MAPGSPANLARSVLEGVWLERSDLTAADLRYTRLSGAHLAGATFSGATLQGANLRGADLSHADLRGADLSGTILDGTTLTGAQADKSTIWPPASTPKDAANLASSKRPMTVLSRAGRPTHSLAGYRPSLARRTPPLKAGQ